MTRQPEFVVFEDKAGEFRWRLEAGNGEPVAASEGYRRYQTAVNSAYRVQEIAGAAKVVTVVPEARRG